MDGLTVEEIAAQHNIDPITVYRWSNRKEWLHAIVDTQGPTIRYDPKKVQDLVHKAVHSDVAPMTVREIAARYQVSLDTVHRWVRSPRWQQAVVGMRGVAKEYDPQQVDELVRERIWLPPEQPTIPKDRLLTMEEIADYTGIPYRDVKHMAANVTGRGSVLGKHDDVNEDHSRMWKRSTVDERVRGRQKRKGRRKEG